MIKSLTGMRFYAAMLVFVSHLYLYNYLFGITHGPVYDFLNEIGWMGVSLFFVLSGFVLAINYMAPGKTITPGRFYIARLARVYPMFALTALLAVPIALFSHGLPGLYVSLPLNLMLIHCFHPVACSSLNSPGWSLSSEAVFYLLFPALAGLFFHRVWRNVALALLACLCFTGLMNVATPASNFYAMASFPLNRVAEFILGMTAGHLYLRYSTAGFLERLRNRPGVIQLGLLLTGLLLVLMSLQPVLLRDHPHAHQVFYFFYAGPAFLIILLLAFLERIGPMPAFLSGPLAVLGGEISYSFYLLHHLVLRYAKHVLKFAFHIDVITLSPLKGVALAFSLLLVSLALARFCYDWVEKPCRNWILGQFNKRPPEAALVGQPT
jgi:peptidoglycan/LPS O-acetylase OafA/YrhL